MRVDRTLKNGIGGCGRMRCETEPLGDIIRAIPRWKAAWVPIATARACGREVDVAAVAIPLRDECNGFFAERLNGSLALGKK